MPFDRKTNSNLTQEKPQEKKPNFDEGLFDIWIRIYYNTQDEVKIDDIKTKLKGKESEFLKVVPNLDKWQAVNAIDRKHRERGVPVKGCSEELKNAEADVKKFFESIEKNTSYTR